MRWFYWAVPLVWSTKMFQSHINNRTDLVRSGNCHGIIFYTTNYGIFVKTSASLIYIAGLSDGEFLPGEGTLDSRVSYSSIAINLSVLLHPQTCLVCSAEPTLIQVDRSSSYLSLISQTLLVWTFVFNIDYGNWLRMSQARWTCHIDWNPSTICCLWTTDNSFETKIL